MMQPDLSALLDQARAMTEQAGPLALAHFRQPLAVDDKHTRDQYDPVTCADRDIERFLRQQLAEHYPDHGVVGEEEASTAGSSDFSWIIDPIDGTRAFISGMPAWGIMLGLRYRGIPVAGVIHQPYLRETFSGGPQGASLHHAGTARALRTSDCQTLAQSILYCTHPSIFPTAEELDAFERVARGCRMMRYGGDCYAYCLLAMGCVDLIIESGLEPYDVQPLIPIIEGAGGVISDRNGSPATAGGFVVAAANAQLHAEALRALNA